MSHALSAAWAFTALACAGVAAAASADLHVMQPTATATAPMATTGAVYLMIHNAGAVTDRLIGASTPVAARVEIHRVSFKDGVMVMRPLDGIDIAPGGMIEFRSGTQHLMLLGLKQPLKAGEKFEVTLKFAKAGEIRVSVPVTPLVGSASAMPGMAPGMQH